MIDVLRLTVELHQARSSIEHKWQLESSLSSIYHILCKFGFQAVWRSNEFAPKCYVPRVRVDIQHTRSAFLQIHYYFWPHDTGNDALNFVINFSIFRIFRGYGLFFSFLISAKISSQVNAGSPNGTLVDSESYSEN